MSYPFEAGLSLGSSYTGQASSLTAQVLDNTGALLLSVPTFVEIGSGTGVYAASITLTDSWNGVIVYTWTGTPAITATLSEPITARTTPTWYTAPVDVSANVATILSRVDVATSTRADGSTYTSARATKLDNLDATVSSRNATAPDNTSIATILTRTDVATSTRLATSGYTAPDNTSITTILGRVDVATSTRLATSGYTAPDNATIASISTNVGTVLTNEATINTNVLTRLATSGYTTPPAVAVDGSGRVILQPAEHTSIGTETAAAVLVTPANKIASNASGQVVSSSVVGSVGSVTAGVTVTTNSDKTGYALTTAEHTAISGTDVPAALTAQGYTSARGTKLDNLDATVSSRNATAPDNAGIASANASLATVITNEGTINTNVLSRLATTAYTAPPTDYQQRSVAVTLPSTAPAGYGGSSGVDYSSTLNAILAQVDVTTSSRLAASAYTAPPTDYQRRNVAVTLPAAPAGYGGNTVVPDNDSISLILSRTDVTTSSRLAATADPTSALATVITNQGTINSNVGTRLAASAYTAPPTDYQQRGVAVTLPAAPTGYGGNTTAPDNAGIATLVSRVDVTVSSRADASVFTPTRGAKLDALDATVSSRLAGSAYAAPPTDYQQRGVAVTLPTSAPTGYGGSLDVSGTSVPESIWDGVGTPSLANILTAIFGEVVGTEDIDLLGKYTKRTATGAALAVFDTTPVPSGVARRTRRIIAPTGGGLPTPPAPSPIAVGHYALNIASPWNQSTATGFNARYGRYPAIVHQFVPVKNTLLAPYNESTNRALFDTAFANDALTHSAVPLFSHELRDHAVAIRIAQPNYTLDKWISGINDAPLIAWFQGAAAWGHRFLYRFGWEMTGYDYTWAVNFSGNNAAKYILFWQHVVALQRQYAPLGEPVWCPSVLLPANAALSPMQDCYPGDDWVSWVGLDGYITGSVSASGPNRSFLELFQSSVATLSSFAPTKKVVICETGVNPTIAGSYSVDWLLAIPAAAPQLPTVKAIVFFDNQQSIIHNEPQKTAITTIVQDAYLSGTVVTP